MGITSSAWARYHDDPLLCGDDMWRYGGACGIVVKVSSGGLSDCLDAAWGGDHYPDVRGLVIACVSEFDGWNGIVTKQETALCWFFFFVSS